MNLKAEEVTQSPGRDHEKPSRTTTAFAAKDQCQAAGLMPLAGDKGMLLRPETGTRVAGFMCHYQLCHWFAAGALHRFGDSVYLPPDGTDFNFIMSLLSLWS